MLHEGCHIFRWIKRKKVIKKADAERLCLLHNWLHHRTGTDAAGAYTNLLGTAGHGGNPNLLQIGQPTPSCLVVGVTDIVSGNWLFAADFT